MRLVSSSQESPRLDLVSMLSFPLVFISSARESDRNRINMMKRGGDCSIGDSNSDSETDREEPAEKIGRKYDGPAKYRVKYNDIGGDVWQAAKVVDAIEGGTQAFHYRV